MILSGLEVVTRQLVRNLQRVSQQQQPCGVDLTLRQVSEWTSAATMDFDNTKRQAAKISSLPFDNTSHTITLQPGAYLIDFNETVQIPRNCMASVFPRSSLWRSGVEIDAGVVDAGYEGAMGALMEVKNPNGIVLIKMPSSHRLYLMKWGKRSRDTAVSTSPQRIVLDAMEEKMRNVWGIPNPRAKEEQLFLLKKSIRKASRT